MALPVQHGSSCLVTGGGVLALTGTCGYLAPEFSRGKLGTQSDVYSYGIVGLAIWADLILHFTQVVLETYTAQLAFSEERDDDNLVRLSGYSYMLHCVLIFPFSPQIDHLEDSLSSEVEFSQLLLSLKGKPVRCF